MPKALVLDEDIRAHVEYLRQAWPRSGQSVFDQVDETLHTHEIDGTLELSTPYLDKTRYSLSGEGRALCVSVQRLDNYKLHLRAKYVQVVMDDDDWSDLRQLLNRLVHEHRSYQRLAGLKSLRPLWASLIEALYPSGSFGERPRRFPALSANPSVLAIALHAILKRSKRRMEWEWKLWSDEGIVALNKLLPVREAGFKVDYPDSATRARICDSDAFRDDVLAWFDDQLAPHGMTLVAIATIDEYQGFGLVPTATILEIQKLLNTLCIHHLPAPRYRAGD